MNESIKQIFNSLFSKSEEKIKKEDEEYLKTCHSPWTGYRGELINQKLELEKVVDKTVFAISSGAIGISLAVLDKIAPANEFWYFYFLLGFGWLLLVISLIYQTISFIATTKKITESISTVEEILDTKSFDQLREKEDKYYTELVARNKQIDRVSKISFVCMLTGISFVLLFSFVSLFAKNEKQPEKINITISDSLINKLSSMSKVSKSNDSKKDSSQSSDKKQTKNQLGKDRQAEQIKTPPIKSKPREK